MTANKFPEPIDKMAIASIICLSLIAGLLWWGGYGCGDSCWFHTGARVSDFSWQNKLIGREDRAFLLTFNRPMDRQSVEQNLVIEPPLPGKISWSGLRLAYTLLTPAPYGETYRLSLQQAQDRFVGEENKSGKLIKPFRGEFRSRDRAFAYIGSQGEEEGKLILYNWTRQQKTILTPEGLTVFDFEPYPQGDRILFSAAKQDRETDDILALQLYTVTTNLNYGDRDNFTPQVKLILDNKKYQNNKFDLAQDGKTIVVQRINRDRPSELGLWVILEDKPPALISDSPGGDFLIAPDSQTVAVARGEGIALLPLKPNAEPLDFLAQFGQVLNFSADGLGAAMVDYNTDNPQLRYTRSLFYVNNQGVKKELLNTKGSILDCKFNPTATHLYCLLTEPEITEEYREKPYIAEINLKTGTINTLVSFPQYQDSKISVAPDGLGLLFDLAINQNSPVINTESERSLWFLIPSLQSASEPQVEQLPFIGFRPQWLP